MGEKKGNKEEPRIIKKDSKKVVKKIKEKEMSWMNVTMEMDRE